MLIKAYGEYWSREGISSRGQEILGRRKNEKKRCNIWNQRGIYVLYKDFKIIYVGKADDRGIGKRLIEHGKGRLKRRWDSFSWFGVSAFDQKGQPVLRKSSTSSRAETIRSLELLAILVSDSPLNRQEGKFPGAEKVWQVEITPPESNIDERLDQILSELKLLGSSQKRRRLPSSK
jgi:hypothetical protein